MEFQILSHAGLLVKNKEGTSLVCDPWLLGSCYWRSWWNYPPVSLDLINSITPDYIYLTHIHWDHFHGHSLSKFSKETPIIVPKGNYSRITDDLKFLGYSNITELKHGESLKLGKDFEITSYQFWMFLDSALLINCENIKLLNLNDTKLMGLPLKSIIRKHKPIDFVFRSHSSANERLSYNIVDDQTIQGDDLENYIKDFAQTVVATGAKYAIPFASSHCHLHKDSFHFNKHIQHPKLVKDYFARKRISSPQLQIMVSGDKWSSEDGFNISEFDWFENREELLKKYLQENTISLNTFYQEEDKAVISKNMVDSHFKELSKDLPFFVKWFFKGIKFTYVLSADSVPKYIYNIDISNGTVEQISKDTLLDFIHYPLQIHTTAFIFQKAIQFKIFSHMCIGKRVFYKVTKHHKKYMESLNQIFNCHEYQLFPLSKIFTSRALESWLMRWRELLLYFMLAKDKMLTRKINTKKYLRE
jgi:UDP-MurNAc hydroxylase